MVSLLIADRLDVVAELIEPAIAEAQEIGSAVGFQHGVTLAGVLQMAGRRPAARRGRPARLVRDRPRVRQPVPPTVAALVSRPDRAGGAGRGRRAAARMRLMGAIPQVMLFNPLLFARAELRRAQGRRAEAIADAREAGARYLASRDYATRPPWRSRSRSYSPPMPAMRRSRSPTRRSTPPQHGAHPARSASPAIASG